MKKSNLLNNIYQFLINPWLMAIIIFSLLMAVSFPRSCWGDKDIWYYIGWLWAKWSIPPYTGAVENKTPGIFILYAVSNLLFGVNSLFPDILGILAMTATSAVIYLTGKKLHNDLAGFFAMLIFGLTMAWRILDTDNPSSTENFMVLFTTLAFLWLIKTREVKSTISYKWHILISGLFMGMSINFKQIAVFSAAALFLFYLTLDNPAIPAGKKIYYDWSLMLAGIVSAIFLSLIPLLISKVSFVDYWKGAWQILLQPGSHTGDISARLDTFKHVWGFTALRCFYPFIILYIIQKRKITDNYIPFWGIIFWIILDFIGANASGFLSGHQIKQIVPSLALASGISIAMLLETKFLEISKKTLAVLIAGGLVIVWWHFVDAIQLQPYREIMSKPIEFPNFFWGRHMGFGESMKLGKWIKEHSKKEDYIYTLGRHMGEVYIYAERRSPSRYFNSIFLSNPGAEEELVRDLRINPPKFIIISKPTVLDVPINGVEEIIKGSYVPLFDKQECPKFIKGIFIKRDSMEDYGPLKSSLNAYMFEETLLN